MAEESKTAADPDSIDPPPLSAREYAALRLRHALDRAPELTNLGYNACAAEHSIGAAHGHEDLTAAEWEAKAVELEAIVREAWEVHVPALAPELASRGEHVVLPAAELADLRARLAKVTAERDAYERLACAAHTIVELLEAKGQLNGGLGDMMAELDGQGLIPSAKLRAVVRRAAGLEGRPCP